jgi:signal transduction histidine kinase
MLEVEELERRKISRELHDDAGQSLVVIRLQMEMLELSFPDADPEMKARLAEIRELTEKTILSVRKLISELSPAVLEQLGLAAAARQLV